MILKALVFLQPLNREASLLPEGIPVPVLELLSYRCEETALLASSMIPVLVPTLELHGIMIKGVPPWLLQVSLSRSWNSLAVL